MFRAALLFPAALLSSAAMASPPSSEARAALERLKDQADSAWNRKDAAAMAALYVEGSSLRVAPDAPEVVGREAIGRFFDAAFARRAGEFRHVTELAGVDMLDEDRALSEGSVRVEQKTEDGGWAVARTFRTLTAAERSGGHWRLRWVRAIPLP